MDAGSVVYIIKAETDQLLKANKQVDKFLSQLQSSFDGADKAADNLGDTLKQAGSLLMIPVAPLVVWLRMLPP
jgi:ABC-type transporter Mla subunit MlaD